MPTVFTGRRIWRRAFACRCDRVRRRRWTRLAAVLCQHRHFNSQSNLAPADAELQSAAPRRRVAYCATGSRQVVPAAAIPMATRLFATSAPTRSCGRAGPQVAGAAPHLAATTARLRVNGVALFGGACVEAEATHAPHVKGQEVSAACSLNVADIFDQQRRFWVRLHEKGGRFCEMPCHHTLEGYLGEYIERARLAEAVRVPCSRPSSIALRARGGSPYRRAGPPHQRVGHGPPACSLDQPHACLAFGWQV